MLTFSNIFFKLADNLLANLPPLSLRFGLPSVRQYCGRILKLPNSKFKFDFVSEKTVLKRLKDLDGNKGRRLCYLSGKFQLF